MCFVTLCEAFLCSRPHLGLWCKLFCVKLQTNVDETCECGSAAISKVAGVKHLEGEFMEMNKSWQEEWFYILDVALEDPPRADVVTPLHLDSPRPGSIRASRRAMQWQSLAWSQG